MIYFLRVRQGWYNSWIAGIIWLASAAWSAVIAQETPCPALNPPTIQGSGSSICRGESIRLQATGCTGTIVWSTGDTIPSITVEPQRTTRYTAICRARKGCISCFADVFVVSVKTPEPPVLSPSSTQLCANDELILTAKGCAGSVIWSNQTTGNQVTIRPQQTTSLYAICQKEGCNSVPSLPATVQIGIPTKPVITADLTEICSGQNIQLTAANCQGIVRWSDGVQGNNRLVNPLQTTTYRAVCSVGSCRSDSADALTIRVRSSMFNPPVKTLATNGCPFQTADLTRLIQESPAASLKGNWFFKTGPSAKSPTVQSPMAVESGQYYILFQDINGCFSNPVAVSATITACANAIPVCISNPSRLVAWVDTLDNQKGYVRLKGQLRGSASTANWQSMGDGLLTDPDSLVTRYLFSETDRQRGSVTLTLHAPDPDGNGPCQGATATLSVMVPNATAQPMELIGLSKKVFEPVWLNNTEVEVSYQLTVSNLGKNPLRALQISDDLERAFLASGVQIRSVSLRTDDSLMLNTTYSGRGIDTTLLAGNNTLPVQANRSLYLTVRLDVSQANTLTFENRALAWATDVDERVCLDHSTAGTDPDPDHNGNPADNFEPTVITLQAIPTEAGTVFIPEGFSPNGDGINDRFVIQYIPAGVSIDLEVFNRWGHVVYRNRDYKNDWDGNANQGLNAGAAKQGLPEGTYFYVVRLSNGKEFARFLTLSR